MTSAEHEIDQNKHEAYVKSIEADKLLVMGRIEDARFTMEAAAALDKTYVVRAELLGRKDPRKIQVSATVRRILIPFLTTAGFAVSGGGRWSEGTFLSRHHEAHMILIGRDKFGHRLGILAARRRDPSPTEYFDWRTVGIRSGCLAYTTQEELEVVCWRWCDILSWHLFPWLDAV
ncbi:hypothetical protein U14_01943 [Candidatus Moduliflexus flocculans]|uniref:Uncharacterized protein n=1 Tax=Candidatus Moduliflexus flocculans TaxID=1499966 RepID=A0A0S6VZ16_9BACT|nr:hypothetical protein U14_01943 [Candidatus Moduliflexus flocculans]